MRVMLVEDNPLQRRALAMLLRGEGLAVQEAVDGADALAAMERADTDEPNVLITDGEMPRLDGVGLTRAIRQRGNTVPIIMVSGQAAETFIAAAKDAGVNHYLRKPVDVGTLLGVMSRLGIDADAAA
jgi:CheY-like chemotaxis protein